MVLLATGKSHEDRGNLAFAHADYQEALRLDHESQQAKEAFDRVNALLKKEEIQRLLSQGLAAYHDKDYQGAKAKLLHARSLNPASEEIRSALVQVDQAIALHRIESLEKAAIKAEKEENWEQALKAYMAVLKIDQTVRFANRGKERSLRHIQVQKRIRFFLNDPRTLETDDQLTNAMQLVEEVQGMKPLGPGITAQLKSLSQLVQEARTPVKVIIASDNLTEVAVYKVGKLGRFASRELDLRPGTYTVVGARDGYKDVRQDIAVKPGQGPIRVSIKCTVKI
jgi:tetratricopeptide (TPR) repeat protein